MDYRCIRNFVITAHVDHGKSTLADRLLELTETIECRSMRPQYLDRLDLERERGITIKMAPVRMTYRVKLPDVKNDPNIHFESFILNLIDTPGHFDFTYEVSRALTAVEGVVLLVDATQGIQAQTISNLESARRANLTIIGAVNKIDIAGPEQIETAITDIAELIGVPRDDIVLVSGKTGTGAQALLRTLIKRIPPPREATEPYGRALVFDSFYDEHRGVIAFVRVFDGTFTAGDQITLAANGVSFRAKDIGYLTPEFSPTKSLQSGEIGYIATGIKNPGDVRIGDTLFTPHSGTRIPFPGYAEPQPVVFVSFYPETSDSYRRLRQALSYLKLNDASLTFEPILSDMLGRGFKGGFLGQLHFEITADRLVREFNIETVQSFPSVAHKIRLRGDEWVTVTNPHEFPDDPHEILEPVTKIELLTPPRYLGAILTLQELFRLSDIMITTAGTKTIVSATLPLADLVSDFDDKLKSLSEGYASLSYETTGWKRADVGKLEILIAGTVVAGLTRIVPRSSVEREGRTTVEKLRKLLPRRQFAQAIQARTGGRIIARETIPALRKDVTGYLYGGDRTRKMKLWKKQRAGKKKLLERGEQQQTKIPTTIFKELLKR